VSNTALETNVRDQLSGDARVDASRIKIDADGGVVVLSGVVDSLHEKLRAAEDVMRLTGVRELRNDLVVNTSHVRVSDRDLRATAQAGLDANDLVPKDTLTVRVKDGWVTLSGNVRHYYQRQEAERVIRHLSGVQGFTSNVTVANDPTVDVSKAITAAFERNAVLDAQKVTVTDVGGVVTLSGTVKNLAEKEEAERAASAAPGVVSVTNHLVVAAASS
jgi:osmotically-inducible protein OsmY